MNGYINGTEVWVLGNDGLYVTISFSGAVTEEHLEVLDRYLEVLRFKVARAAAPDPEDAPPTPEER